jgi:type II secretion system protein N
MLPAALILIAIFVALLFPWDSVGRRIGHEISMASGSQVSIGRLSPALTGRGPVLTAEEVIVQHPAVDRVRIARLEIAPRLSTSWFGAEPTLRFWADSELAVIDGVLQLGESPKFVGQVSRIEIEKLPLRLEASGLELSGQLSADADVALDPRGVLTGRVQFESPALLVQSDRLPIAIPFTRAAGIIEMLPTGATQIEILTLEGNVVGGELSGEISMAHRSQSPPIDLTTRIQIVQPELRSLAPGAGITLSKSGEASLRVRGTIDAPEIEPLRTPNRRANRAGNPS